MPITEEALQRQTYGPDRATILSFNDTDWPTREFCLNIDDPTYGPEMLIKNQSGTKTAIFSSAEKLLKTNLNYAGDFQIGIYDDDLTNINSTTLHGALSDIDAILNNVVLDSNNGNLVLDIDSDANGGSNYFGITEGGGNEIFRINQDGSIVLTGDVNFGGNDIVNVNNILSNGSIVFGIDEDNNGTGQYFSWRNNGSSELMRLTETGDLGLGVTPAYSLHIERPTGAQITLTNTGDSSADVVLNSTRLAGSASGRVIFANSDLEMSDIRGVLGTSTTKMGLQLYTYNAGKNLSMSIDENSDIITYGDLTVTGDLTINGTTTTLNTTTLDVEDINITLANGAPNATAANGGGITLEGANATMLYNSSTDRWDFNKGVAFSEGGQLLFFDEASSSPRLSLEKNESTIDGDLIGLIRFLAKDSVNNLTNYSQIKITSLDVTDGSETGKLDFDVRYNDVMYTRIALESDVKLYADDSTTPVARYESNLTSLMANSPGQSHVLYQFTNQGDTIDSVLHRLYGLGVYGNTTNSEHLQLGWWAPSLNYEIRTRNTGAGVSRDLVLYTGSNTNQLFLSTNGNVGIGTAIPQYEFDLVGSLGLRDGQAVFWHDGTGTAGRSGAIFTSTDIVRLRTYEAAGEIVLETGTSSEAVRIDSSGNVGIGTASPSYKLDVNGEIHSNDAVSIGSTASPAGVGLFIEGTPAVGSYSPSSGTLLLLENSGTSFIEMVGDSAEQGLNFRNATTNTVIGSVNNTTQTLKLSHQSTIELYVNSVNRFKIADGDAIEVSILDNKSTGISIKESSNNYLTVSTTNSSEKIDFGNATTNPDYNFLGSGELTTGGNVSFGGIIDSSSYAEVYAEGPTTDISAETTFNAASEMYIGDLVTFAAEVFAKGFTTSDGNNNLRCTYTNTVVKKFFATASISFSGDTVSTIYHLEIFKYDSSAGTQIDLPCSEVQVDTSNNSVRAISIHCLVQLDQNDYIGVKVKANSAGRTYKIEHASLMINPID